MVPTRRLAAILAADIADYSRLMHADEEGTHGRVKAHLRELVNPKFHEHRGRIVKYTGDGMLVEFASVVGAVRCAAEIQRGMIDRDAARPDTQRIKFRIGIHVGDVIVEPEDIYGDGVNIAARLEGLAEVNGICISRMVHEYVRDRLPYRFTDLGEKSVKNIARPVHVFALPAAVIAELPPLDEIAVSPPNILDTPAVSHPANTPRLSIVVLPFNDLSGDQEQQYFADGLTEDVTTDLSRIADMVVISRNTAFTYRNKTVNTKQIGRELNVRYVLEGRVRRSGNRVRVNAQLIDAATDAHVWADRFDSDTVDLFAFQDEVTSRIAVALNLELVGAEAARPTDSPDALDYILRGRAALYHSEGLTREHFADGINLFESALKIDPESVSARALLALALSDRVLEQMTDTAAADLARAEVLIEHVLLASPHNPLAHFARGQVLRARNRFEAAIPEYEAAVALDRNWVAALAALGQCKFLAGSIEEAIPAQEQAIRLSPRDPRVANWYWRIGMVHLLQSRTEAAILWIEKARSVNPGLAGPHGWLASAYALQGKIEQAAAELAEARRLSRDGRYSSIVRYEIAQSLGAPNRHLVEKTFYAGLRQAGVPDE
jgi:TolB-like protein/class 3 adenylate cyclase/Tfp pilus assembly protein PilF